MSSPWSSSYSRRDWLRTVGAVGAATGLSRIAPLEALAAQAAPPDGKDARLIIRSARPPDYETPVALLDTWITPNDQFYVRSHLPTPPLALVQDLSLQVDGLVGTPLTLTLEALQAMPRATVTVSLECAGNGRAFFEPTMPGIQWERGAVGNARWTGARLADILTKAGVRDTARNVAMHGGDRPLGTMPPFIRQVPMAKAMHPDTIIAYEMNGQPLPLVHGFPFRAIVPGWEGAYAVKWLSRIQVIDTDFDGFWVATAYRYPRRPVAPGAAVPPADMLPVQGLVVKSILTRPLDGAIVAPGRVAVAGHAWAGERDIARVDISTDRGVTWQPARLVGEQARYAWRRFEFDYEATTPGSHVVLSRATDSEGEAQPMVPAWNPSGYLWNVADQVRFEVQA
ncbi:MAG: sulfite oxidase [Vicinamibacterales bacterium]|nr:sulfite oxidase [Vicinamibacterales bacterium]